MGIKTGAELTYVIKDCLGSSKILVKNTGPVKSWQDYTPFGEKIRSSNSTAKYMLTGQEKDEETGLYNYRARLYDPYLKRFLDIDPAGQGFSPYAYAGNNPVVFIDPDGELAWFVPMLIGGAINLAANWDNIDNFAQGIGYFTGGAIGGGLSVLGPVGWAIGGSITNSTNAYLGGARGNDLLLAGAVGGVSGLAGGYGSQLASKYVGGIALNGLQVNSNSAIGGAISGAIGGAAGGFAGGFTGGFLMTGNLSDAFDAGLSGLKSGAITGTVIGAGYGYYEANKAGLDPWTGKPIKSAVIGRAQKEWVNPTAKDLKSETISPDWENEFGNREVSPKEGIPFNKNWINNNMNDGVHIYDIERPPLNIDTKGKYQGISLYYDGVEHSALRQNNYNRYYKIRQIGIKILPNGKSYYYYKTNPR